MGVSLEPERKEDAARPQTWQWRVEWNDFALGALPLLSKQPRPDSGAVDCDAETVRYLAAEMEATRPFIQAFRLVYRAGGMQMWLGSPASALALTGNSGRGCRCLSI